MGEISNNLSLLRIKTKVCLISTKTAEEKIIQKEEIY